jgi:hypothetical protein
LAILQDDLSAVKRYNQRESANSYRSICVRRFCVDIELHRRHPKMSCISLVVAVTAVTLVFSGTSPSCAFDIHYLSVGNAAYREEQLTIPDANTSARQIAGLLRRIGSKGGITLLSEENAYVTATDVKNSLRTVAEAAASEADPLVVYYFIGHGRTAEPGGVHVSLTGAYDGRDTTVATSQIETIELREILEKLGLPYLIILDNCYYREPVDGITSLGRAVGDKFFGIGLSIGAIPSGLEPRIEARRPQITIYAASPGSVAQTVPHPESDAYAIGPLARRLLLLLDEAPEGGLSVRAWLDGMTDGSFDPQSVAGHSENNIDQPGATLIPASWPEVTVDGTTLSGSAGGNQ